MFALLLSCGVIMPASFSTRSKLRKYLKGTWQLHFSKKVFLLFSSKQKMCVGSGSETKQCMALEAAAAALEGCKQAQVCACSSAEQTARL